MPEPGDDAEAAQYHESDCKRVASLPIKFWHVFEVHAVDSGDEGGGHEDGCDDSEGTHDFIESIAGDAELDIDEAAQQFASQVEIFGDSQAVIVEVLEFGKLIGLDNGLAVSDDGIDVFADRADLFSDCEELAFDFESVGRSSSWLFKNLGFEVVDLIVQ